MDRETWQAAAIVVLIGSVIAVAINIGCEYSCSATTAKMGMRHSYGPMQGCMVKTPKGWRPLGQYRSVDE